MRRTRSSGSTWPRCGSTRAPARPAAPAGTRTPRPGSTAVGLRARRPAAASLELVGSSLGGLGASSAGSGCSPPARAAPPPGRRSRPPAVLRGRPPHPQRLRRAPTLPAPRLLGSAARGSARGRSARRRALRRHGLDSLGARARRRRRGGSARALDSSRGGGRGGLVRRGGLGLGWRRLGLGGLGVSGGLSRLGLSDFALGGCFLGGRRRSIFGRGALRSGSISKMWAIFGIRVARRAMVARTSGWRSFGQRGRDHLVADGGEGQRVEHGDPALRRGVLGEGGAGALGELGGQLRRERGIRPWAGVSSAAGLGRSGRPRRWR